MNQSKACPYTIAGNKADLVSERVIDEEAIKMMEQQFNSQCFLTSAVTGQGVEEIFHQLINDIAPIKIASLTLPTKNEGGN